MDVWRFARFGGGLLLVSSTLAVGGLAEGLQAQASTVVGEGGATPRSGMAHGATSALSRSDGRIEYLIGTTSVAVSVDGRMDESEWASAVVILLPYEVSPAENGTAPVVTECRLTHDAENLYLGCRAEDPDPDAIRAYVVDRDAIYGQDRIVLTLDPFNDQRRAFQFGISALGVQSDAVLAQQGAGNPHQGPDGIPADPSWDAIWSSAGTITENGFVVEAAIPFRSLRFPRSTEETSWGVYITRWWPRSSNVELRSATWDRSDSCLLCQANVLTGLHGISPGANVQLTPTLTGSRTSSRTAAQPSQLVAGPSTSDLGIDAQWGVTSELTLNFTANPDFSQVEADVAQLEVNTRFALFFPEKRPFFLEGADFFGTPIQAVFTRSIADPTAGAKLTGKLGSNALGLLVAQDRSNNLLIPGSQSSSSTSLEGEVTTAIGRIRRDVGSTSTIGALFTGREGAGYHNRVGGFDAFYRPVPSLTLQGQLLRSDTEYPLAVSTDFEQPAGSFSGNAAQLRAQWGTRDWMLFANGRRIEQGFRADAGFLAQAGVRGGNVNLTRRFWGSSDGWFSQIRLEGGAWRNEDFDRNPLDGGVFLGLAYDGPWQTSIGIFPNILMREHFAGVTYRDMSQLWFDVRMAPSGTFSFGLNGNVGDAIDYANARLGSELRLAPLATVRLGRHVEASFRHTYQRLRNQNERVFTANLSQLTTVYNFSPRSFVRAIAQYQQVDRNALQYVSSVDQRNRSLLTQLLYAYKLNPQTVLFLGYTQEGTGLLGADTVQVPITTRGRTFFMKLGYAWRP